MDNKPESAALCIGLSGLQLAGRAFDFGEGIELRATFAHLFSTDILAFARPETPTSFHPGPWQAISHKPGVDITAELSIPAGFKGGHKSAVIAAHTIVSLLRLWVDPAISIQMRSAVTIGNLKHRAPETGAEPVAELYSARHRYLDFEIQSRERIFDSITWVISNWRAAVALRAAHPEYALAIDTFDNAQCIPSTAMMLVSIWGALEAVFAPHKSELVFRASAQLAAFLEERGEERMRKQQEIVKLYNLRSAAAHGFPKHQSADVLHTFELLRMAIVRMTERRQVPTKGDLERYLFC
jgi:hypothetical protein